MAGNDLIKVLNGSLLKSCTTCDLPPMVQLKKKREKGLFTTALRSTAVMVRFPPELREHSVQAIGRGRGPCGSAGRLTVDVTLQVRRCRFCILGTLACAINPRQGGDWPATSDASHYQNLPGVTIAPMPQFSCLLLRAPSGQQVLAAPGTCSRPFAVPRLRVHARGSQDA